MGSSRLSITMKLGTVPFLNARPLTIALEGNSQVELVVEPPSKLAQMLESGELDGALVSSFALFQMQGARFVPGVGIASHGPVESIRLYCRKPADSLRRVGLDSWSLAATNMARVYLKHRWGAEPEFVPIDPLKPPREDESIDAFLLIGDNALREPPGEHYVLDLGEEWRNFTGLPFVYALWVFRPGAGDAEAAALLQNAKKEGVGKIEEIVNGALPPGVDKNTAWCYLTECIRYDVGDEELEGLRRYYELLVEDGLAPEGWEPRFVDEEGAHVVVMGDAVSKEDDMSDDLCFSSIHDLAGMIRKKEVSPVEVAEAHLRRIEALNPEIFAYQTVTAEAAMEAARAAEAEIVGGQWRGPMHGVPYGAKDIVDTAGVLTTNGSSFHRDNVPREDAEIIRRLKDAGAVMLGKTTTHEFAAAPVTINPHYGTVRNPWNTERIVGGSSGGSGAACAAGLAPAAIGTDTGGSIRNPSSLCGGVGLKATHGRVSLRGICPNSLSFDHPGPMTRTARDAGLMLQAMAGYDAQDSKSQNVPVPDYTASLEDGVRGSRILVCPNFHGDAEVDSEIMSAFEAAVEVFRALGARVEEVSFTHYQKLMDLFPLITGPEFSEFHRPFFEQNPGGYGEDVLERLEWSFQIAQDDYVRAMRERVLMQREVAGFFEGADALVQPAMPCVAPPIATLLSRMNGRDVPYKNIHRPFLGPHNATGFPALVTPMGRNSEGMPTSLQIVSGPWRETDVLRVAHAYEEATPELRNERPPVGA